MNTKNIPSGGVIGGVIGRVCKSLRILFFIENVHMHRIGGNEFVLSMDSIQVTLSDLGDVVILFRF